jgi:hypothetical protein
MWQGTDSLAPGRSVLFTKDSAALREWLGASDIPVRQVRMGSLLNRADTLRLCQGETRLDSLFWLQGSLCDSTLAQSPGFVRRGVPGAQGMPARIALNRRGVSLAEHKGTQALQARVESPVPGRLRLVSREGRALGETPVKAADAGTADWTPVPHWRKCGTGPCFLHFLGEGVHEVAAFVVRP